MNNLHVGDALFRLICIAATGLIVVAVSIFYAWKTK